MVKELVKYRNELFKKISGTDNRIQAGGAYTGGNPPDIQGIQIDDTGVGKAAERNGGFGKERAAPRFPKD